MSETKETEKLQETPEEEKKEEVIEEKTEDDVTKDASAETEEEEKKEETVETPIEEVKEEEAEDKVEKNEPKTDEEVEEKEEVPEEEKKEEVVEEKAEDEDKEALVEEIKKDKEELAVIREVRDELVTVYAKNKELEQLNKELTIKFEHLEADNKKNVEQLQKYLIAEEKYAEKKKLERLEQLSAKFKKLGQEKTVEQLGLKDDATIAEFEMIVDAAIDKSAETKEMPSATSPSQGQVEQLEKVVEVKKQEKESLSEKDMKNQFFTNVAKKLTAEQLSDRSKKVLQL